jgi:hypothetical protein
MNDLAPWTGVIFPIMIVFLSYTIDADVDGKTAVQKYKDAQQQRLDLLIAKKDMLSKILAEESQITLLERSSNALKNLFFTKNKFLTVVETVTTKVSTTIQEDLKTTKEGYEQSQQDLLKKVTEIEQITQTIESTKQLILNAESQIEQDKQYIINQLASVRSSNDTTQIEEIINREFPRLLTTSLNNYLPSIVTDLQTQMQKRLDQLERSHTQLIEERLDTLHQSTVLELTEEVHRVAQLQVTTSTSNQKQISSQKEAPETVISEIEDEEEEEGTKTSRKKFIEPHNDAIIAKTPKQFNYALTDNSFRVGEVTFAKSDAILPALKIADITERDLKQIALLGLVDPDHFRYVRTNGFGNIHYRLMIEVNPSVRNKIAEAFEILKNSAQ